MEINIDSIREFIETNKETEEVQSFINSFKVAQEPSLELFKDMIESDKDFKSFMDSERDKHLSKGIETFKTNNLEKLVNDEIKVRFPESDPKDLALQELQRKIESMEQEKNYERLTNVALKQATERGLPSDLINFFIGQDEESTLSNLSKLEEVFNSKLETSVKDRLKGDGYVPPKSSGSKTITKQDFMKMGFLEQQKFATENADLYEEIMS